jgi:hypothetical protein
MACWRVLSLQLRSGRPSSQWAAVGPSSARWNDCENDRRLIPEWLTMLCYPLCSPRRRPAELD